MQEAIDKARVLIEAHQYIRSFANKRVVVKVGGSIMDSPDALAGLLMDICFLDAVGIRPIIVHGGGKAITQAMNDAGIEAQFVQGRRYTDDRTLAIAEEVLVNQVNAGIVNQINLFGHHAMGLHSLSSCAVFGKRLYLESDDDRKIDLGLVGEPHRVNADLLQSLTDARVIPVIAPIARDDAGGKLNINADSVTGAVAAAIGAEKLVLISDTHGIRTGDTDDTLASHLTEKQIRQLISRGVIGSGMLPKVDAALTALNAGVGKVHIIDGRIQHSLLLEIFSSHGIGTEIVLN